jgi:putative permease
MSDGTKSVSIAGRIGRAILFFGTVGIILYLMRPVYTPIIISFLIAYITAPVVDYFESFGVPRVLSVSIIFVIFFVLLAFSLVFLVPVISEEVQGLANSVPQFLKSSDVKLREWLFRLEPNIPGLNAAEVANQVTAKVRDFGGSFLREVPTYIRGLGSIFVLFILVPFVTFFFLKDGRPIKRFFVNMVPNRYFEMTLMLLHEITVNLGGYLRGQMVRMVVISFLIWIGLSIINIPYALVLGLFCGVLNIIPFLGPWLGAIPAAIIAVVTGNSFWLVVLVNLIVQVLDMTVATPVTLGRGTQLPALVVVLVVIIGGYLMGIVGMILAIPVTSVIRVTITVVRENLRSYEFT